MPYKLTWGESLHRCTYSLPRWTRSSPQPRAGGRRVQLPGGAAFDSRMYRPTMSSVTVAVDARLRGCAALHTCTHACTSPLPTHMPAPSLSLTMNARARLAPRLRVISAISACVILAGSFFLRTISVRSVQCTRISVHNHMCGASACHV